jgi:hypothetical protein
MYYLAPSATLAEAGAGLLDIARMHKWHSWKSQPFSHRQPVELPAPAFLRECGCTAVGAACTVPYLIDRAGVATAVFYVANCHFNSGATSAPHGFVAKGMGLSVDFLAGRVARAPLLQLSRKTGPVSWLPLKVRAASAPSCPNSAGIIGPVCKLWAR